MTSTRVGLFAIFLLCACRERVQLGELDTDEAGVTRLVDPTSDPTNCGRAGHDCEGGPCVGGVCQPVTLATFRARNPLSYGVPSLPVDERGVYLLDHAAPTQGMVESSARLLRIPRSGGPATHLGTIVVHGQIADGRIAVDETGVYYTDFADALRTTGAVWRLGHDGGPAVPLVRAQGYALSIALDASNCYWIANASTASQVVRPVVFSVPKHGGEPRQLGDVTIGPLLVGGDSIYATTFDRYVGLKIATSIMRRSIADGTGSRIATDQAYTIALGMDATHLYWSNWGIPTADRTTAPHDGEICTMPKDGGDVVKLATGLYGVSAIAVDETYVYYLAEGFSLFRVTKSGGASERLVAGPADAAGDTNVGSITVHGRAIYWTVITENPSRETIGHLQKLVR